MLYNRWRSTTVDEISIVSRGWLRRRRIERVKAKTQRIYEL